MPRLFLLRFPAVLIAAMLVSCSRLNAQTNEVAMCPGGSVVVAVGDTLFSIKSTGYLTREIEANGNKRHVTLIPRSERSFGSLGLYNPAAGDSRTHIVMEEGWQHFSSIEEAQYWLGYTKRHLPLEYTSDGLVVASRYLTRPPGASDGPESAMTVNVWLLLVNGARPVGLAGAHDEHFQDVSLPPPTCTKPRPFVASSPKVINGRQYSGRVIDTMAERGLTASDIERLIKTGRRVEENGQISFFDESNAGNIFFVDTQSDGAVVQIG